MVNSFDKLFWTRGYSKLMGILAKTTATVALAATFVIPFKWVSSEASVHPHMPWHLSQQVAFTVALTLPAGYEPPDDIGGPGSSQGSGTR